MTMKLCGSGRSGTRMSLGQVLVAMTLTTVVGRKVLKTNETETVFAGITCYGDQLPDGKMCSSVSNMLKCPNTFAKVDSGAFVQCEVVDGQCLTTGGQKQKLCHLPTCDDSLAIDMSRNLVEGVVPKVSSECYKRNPTNKGYLTDGDTRARGRGDRKYWHSCRDNKPNAEVSFPLKCVREVKIWSRADCCAHQMQGVVAEVWSDGKWKRCGGTSGNVGTKNFYSFKCAMYGTKVRIIKHKNNAWITTSELQVFGAINPHLPIKQCTAALRPGKMNLVAGLTPRVSSDCFTPARHQKFLTDGDTREGNNRNDHYWHSCHQRNNWAEVSFPETCIRQVKIWSRPNCCPNQMQGVIAEVWSGGKWQRCGAPSPNVHKHSAPYAFDCAMVGSKVRVSRGHKRHGRWFTISELQVFGPSLDPVCEATMGVDKTKNLAFGVNPRVSSDCYKNARHKKFLTDGDRRIGKRGNHHYWHSCNQRNKWAEVDIPEQCVRQVQIWSRPNCCPNQIQGVVAEVWSEGKWQRCGGKSPNIGKKSAPYAFDCGIVGSKVRISRNHHAWFTVSELEVFGPSQEPQCSLSMGISKTNVALRAPTRVSSDCYKNARHKKFLTDGDRRIGKRGNDHYWHSCNQRKKWAEVTIPEQCVRQVQIWSRPNCCPNQIQGVVAEVWSDGKWKRCGGTSPNIGKKSAPYAFDCAIIGSKVRVSRNHHAWMTVSELEVFGPDSGPRCDDSLEVDDTNLVLGKPASVSSECYKRNPTNKGFLTDGDTRRNGRGDRNYWHSCREKNPRAEVAFPKQCIREVKIWSRADCCSHQMQGVIAEIWSDGQWKRCGGTSGNVGKKNSYSFKCSIVGSKARIIKKKNRAWITTSELEVFGAATKKKKEPKCDSSMSISNKNFARGLRAKVSSECYKRNPTNKGYLTDGDNRKRGHGDRNYWHSCRQNNPNAEVSFPTKCVREVKIWSRADCCSHQMQGIVAEVWSDGKWKRCGGKSNNVGKRNAYSFKCAIVGSKARIIKKKRNAWITTSEMEVFGPEEEPSCSASIGVGNQNVALRRPTRVSSDCFKNARHKKFLTDGDRRKGKRGNHHYWHSCNQRKKWAEVDIPKTCVRKVQIWSRPNCCPNQMQGVVAEVWSDGKWKRCGGTSPNIGKKSAPYAFDCAIIGSKVRVSRNHHAWMAVSELEVFGPDIKPKCDSSMSVNRKNLARGLRAKVSSECYKRNPTNKGYLTDGDNRKRGHGDKKYWHSCRQNNPNAEVAFAEKCIREVKIWSRADCCSHQMQGVVAEIWSDGKWKRCGGKSNNVGKRRSYTFKCAIVGSKARIIKKKTNAWITTSEMEVFAAN